MSKRDYYEVLEVGKDASKEEISKAWKKAALKHHPDRNQGKPEAETLFKEAAEAYGVLSDDAKRAEYDRFGHNSGQAGFQNPFENISDAFSDLFGGFGFGVQGNPNGPAQGEHIQTGVRITFTESYTGTKKAVTYLGVDPCDDCSGSGGESGSKPTKCPTCKGSGAVSKPMGFINVRTLCYTCTGTGKVIAHSCKKCAGSGKTSSSKEILVDIPAGIAAGQKIRVKGQGAPGVKGGPPGDLYIEIEVLRDSSFSREGNALELTIKLPLDYAILGRSIETKLPDGTTVPILVLPGTQPGSSTTVPGKGFPILNSKKRGGLYVQFEVDIPQDLGEKAEKLVRELAKELYPARDETDQCSITV